MKSKVILVLAIIALSIGLYGILNAPKIAPIQTLPIESHTEESIPTVVVWVAKNDLPLGSRLKREDLEIQRISQIQADRIGLLKNTEFDFKNKSLINKNILSGDFVTNEDTLSPGDEGYYSLVVEEGYVPFNLTIDHSDMLGGIISIEDNVDVISISSIKQNLAESSGIDDITSLRMKPLLTNVRVLDIIREEKVINLTKNKYKSEVTIILQLTHRELAIIIIAQRISEIEVYKSIGAEYSSELHADSSDVISIPSSRSHRTTKAIQELRG
jgi:pilus assembly protein CpaB